MAAGSSALYLDQHSVGFLDEGDLAFLGQFALLRDYRDKEQELGQWNGRLREQGMAEVNSRRVTNLGTFRAYVGATCAAIRASIPT